MSNITIGKIIIISLCIITLLVFIVNMPIQSERVYDCGMAEWHPDIPNKVKEECRRLHYEEWKKQQGKTVRAQNGIHLFDKNLNKSI
jgi:hypothetical protein